MPPSSGWNIKPSKETALHGITSQKRVRFLDTTVRTLHPAQSKNCAARETAVASGWL
jgi:hypothetical protein